jgi:coenzyme PQQ synthesis protein D (PqqD)
VDIGLSPRSIVVAARDQVSCTLGTEAAILSLKSGVYYGVDEVGARIWSLLQKPCSVEALREAIIDEYDVEPERCERDLLALLEQLHAEGLIEVRSSTTG